MLGLKREAFKRVSGWEIVITPPAFVKLKSTSLMMTDNQYERYLKWLNGEGLIQEMLPDLSDNEREILMTGIYQDAWDKLFPEDEE